MKIKNNQLIGLRVFTESGQELGVVETFNVETETQSVLEYSIRATSRIKKLIQGEFIINRGQVIEIKKDKMIVDDNNISTHPSLKNLTTLLKKEKNNQVPVTNKNN